jgi:hypothetical protein
MTTMMTMTTIFVWVVAWGKRGIQREELHVYVFILSFTFTFCTARGTGTEFRIPSLQTISLRLNTFQGSRLKWHLEGNLGFYYTITLVKIPIHEVRTRHIVWSLF